MRIIAGQLRGRVLQPPATQAIRPSADKLRGAVFNVLAHAPALAGCLEQARVLDVFCGTGALGFEALSRGASHACFMDADGAALALARHNAASLKVAAQSHFIQQDARQLAAHNAPPFSLVFLDPPYGKGLLPPTLFALRSQHWLAAGAVLVVETGREEPPDFATGFELLDRRIYGRGAVCFLR